MRDTSGILLQLAVLERRCQCWGHAHVHSPVYSMYVYVYYVGMGKGGIGWIKATPVVTQSPKESREQVSRKWCKGSMTCMRNSNNSLSLGLVWSFI